jgi:hypothetical protein
MLKFFKALHHDFVFKFQSWIWPCSSSKSYKRVGGVDFYNVLFSSKDVVKSFYMQSLVYVYHDTVFLHDAYI